MVVDISSVLHVLAHELRTPAGIAQGYIRMLLDDRLTDPSDRRKALEQTQKALARIGELSQESSRLASLFEETPDTALEHIEARLLIERVVSGVARPLEVRSALEPSWRVSTFDANALASALAAMVTATARELREAPCVLDARVHDAATLDVLVGAETELPNLQAGPADPRAGRLALERGGLGLALVSAAAVLDVHRAVVWTTNDSHRTVGIRLPLEKRTDS